MNTPTLESRFKYFWRYCQNQVVNTLFRLYKKRLYNAGFKYQISIYGAIDNRDGQLRGSRVEIVMNKPLTTKSFEIIKSFMRLPFEGYNLVVYINCCLFPIITEYQIKRGLVR